MPDIQQLSDHLIDIPLLARFYVRMKSLLMAKQDVLSWDTTPTADSMRPVRSGGVAAAIRTIENNITFVEPGDTALRAYGVHDPFINADGELCKAIDDIALGDTLEEDTNYEVVDAGGFLNNWTTNSVTSGDSRPVTSSGVHQHLATVSSSVVATAGSGTVSFRSVMGCIVTVYVNVESLTASTWTEIGELPSGIAVPPMALNTLVLSGTDNTSAQLRIAANGKISAFSPDGVCKGHITYVV